MMPRRTVTQWVTPDCSQDTLGKRCVLRALPQSSTRPEAFAQLPVTYLIQVGVTFQAGRLARAFGADRIQYRTQQACRSLLHDHEACAKVYEHKLPIKACRASRPYIEEEAV